MRGGTVIRSIFAFCDVRQFTDTTECLQEEVMLFVNRIAHILHNTVVRCEGAANKNIGDAFLLTWKLDKNLSTDDSTDSATKDSRSADLALYAMLRSLINLNMSHSFICNFSQKAAEHLYRRFPAYQVRLGCGLHVGDAIEGALGSSRKIDVSYLSPSVNFSEFLESSTKQYGVPLLLSGPFYDLLSSSAQVCCRQVDRLRIDDAEHTLKFNTLPPKLARLQHTTSPTTRRKSLTIPSDLPGMAIYTSDIILEIMPPPSDRKNESDRNETDQVQSTTATVRRASRRKSSTSTAKEMKVLLEGMRRRESLERDQIQQARDIEYGLVDSDNKFPVDLETSLPEIKVLPFNKHVWNDDQDLIKAQLPYRNPEFRELWMLAIGNYERGDWGSSKLACEAVIKMNDGDGPAQHLLDIMNEYQFTAPYDWDGALQN